MRRRPIILLLCATAALVGAAIALADSPATSPAYKTLAETPDAQVGPAIAVNPAGGSPNISAIALGTDWRGGVGNPQSVFATGSIIGATGVTNWAPTTILPHTSGVDVGGGSPDVTWGPGNKVYAVELGRDTSAPTDPCATGAGLYFLASSNGGATWGTPIEIVNNSATVAVSEPAIAYNPVSGRIYISYTKTDQCGGGPGAGSTVRLLSTSNDIFTGLITNIPASPTGLRFAHSSIAVLPNGKVGIAYYNDSQSSVQVTICAPKIAAIPSSEPACSPDASVTVDPSASPLDATSTILGLSVEVRPRIAADPTGRVIVTWAKQTPTNTMNVFTATSRTAGMDFGPPQRIPADPGTANQIDPTVAITTGGRADVAFLDTRWDSGGAFRVAVSASNTPSGLGTSENWSKSVYVESTPIVPVAPFLPGPKSLGGRIAVAEIPRTPATAWTLVAWTDTRNAPVGSAPLNEDVYSTVLLHGTTKPVASDATATVQRNMPNTVPIDATDADADPLIYKVVQAGTLGYAEFADPNTPQLTYTGTKLGNDQVTIQVSDGIQTATANVTLKVLNTPPQITCLSLSTKVDTPLPIPATCAIDPNNDPITLDANTPQHGEIQRPGGVLTFVPTMGYEGLAQVTLVASDGIDSAAPQTVNIQVGEPGQIPVTIEGASARVAFTNRPITLTATPAVTGADASKISWSFDGAPPTDQGPTVAHLFTKVRIYTVTARFGDGPVSAPIKVFGQKPLLSLKSTDLAQGVMGLRVQLAKAGKLTVGLLGIPGAHRTIKLKRGPHTLHMKLPLSARTRGTVIVKLDLKAANGATAKMKRAVLLPVP